MGGGNSTRVRAEAELSQAQSPFCIRYLISIAQLHGGHILKTQFCLLLLGGSLQSLFLLAYLLGWDPHYLPMRCVLTMLRRQFSGGGETFLNGSSASTDFSFIRGIQS